MKGILVYSINEIFLMKLNAFSGRDKIRDLYDVKFIYLHYKQNLNPQSISVLRNALAYKGVEQFDYLVKNQHDELTDNEQLSENFLTMYFDIGLC
jgi:predicted nucleotidyltransferase component of viral defense system